MTDTAAWDTAVDVGRYTNIGLALVALGLLIATVRGWRHRSAGNRFLWMGLGVMLFNVAFGTAEQLMQNAGPGWRTAVTTVGVSWILVSLVMKRRGHWYDNEYPRGRNGRSGE